MAQIRNYRKGIYETQAIVPIGQATGGNDFIKADGVLTNAFSDLVLYTDAAGTSAVPLTDYSMTTTDTNATAKEAETGTGGSGKVVHSQYQVTNATYQSIDLWATFSNFGCYTDNDAAFSQVGGKIDVSATGGITLSDGLKLTRVRIDTTSGDVALTVPDGEFDGQQILLKETGLGNKCRVLGSGFYAGADSGGMYLVNRSILCTWNDDDSEWEMDDCVTAEWVSGAWKIESASSGTVSQSSFVSSSATNISTSYGSILRSGASGIFLPKTFPVAFSSTPNPEASLSESGGASPTWVSLVTYPTTTLSGSLRGLAAVAISGTLLLRERYTGTY